MRQLPVVVGVRPGQHPQVAHVAVAEARRRSTSILAVHVRSDPRTDDAAFAGVRDAVIGAPDITCDVLGLDGEVVGTLIEQAAQGSVLVVGADDAPWIDRALGREIARELTSQVVDPVVVVPRTSGTSSQHRGVTVVVESDHDVDAAIVFGFEAAEARQEPLDVVHVAGVTSDYPERQRHWHRIQDVIERWRPLFPDTKVTASVEPGHLMAVCAVAGTRSSLLVLTQSDGNHRVLRKAVTARLLQRSSAPVAIVPGACARERIAR